MSRRSSWRVHPAAGRTMADIARLLWEPHDAWTAAGSKLTRSSGLWQRKDGTLTARLVYRDEVRTVVVTLRRIRVTP